MACKALPAIPAGGSSARTGERSAYLVLRTEAVLLLQFCQEASAVAQCRTSPIKAIGHRPPQVAVLSFRPEAPLQVCRCRRS